MKIQGKDIVYEIDDEKILVNDVIFSHEYNPHNVRLWIIGHEFGPIAALWAAHEQEAFDILTDENLGGAFLLDEDDITEDAAFLGNASEPCNLDLAWIESIDLEKQDQKLLLAFAEARGACYENLYF